MKKINLFEPITSTDPIRLVLREKVIIANKLTHHKYLLNKNENNMKILRGNNNWKVFSHYTIDYITVNLRRGYLKQEDCTFHFVSDDKATLDITLPANTQDVYEYLLSNTDMCMWLVDFHENRGDLWSNTVYHLVDLLNIILFELRGSGILREYYTPEEQKITLGNGLTPYFLGHYSPNTSSTNFFVSLEDEQGNQHISKNITSNGGVHTLEMSGGDIQLKLYSKGSNDTEYQLVNTTCIVVYDQEAGNYFALTYPEYDGEKIQVVAENTSMTLYHTSAITDDNKDVHIVFVTTPEESEPLPEQVVPVTGNILNGTVQTMQSSQRRENEDDFLFKFNITGTDNNTLECDSIMQVDDTLVGLDFGEEYEPVYLQASLGVGNYLPITCTLDTDNTTGNSVGIDVSISNTHISHDSLVEFVLVSGDYASSVDVNITGDELTFNTPFIVTGRN